MNTKLIILISLALINFITINAEELEEKPEFETVELGDHESEKLNKSIWEQFEKLKVNEQIANTFKDTELAGLQPSIKGPFILRSTRNNRIVGMLAIGFSSNFCVEYENGIPIKTYFKNNFGDERIEYTTFKECHQSPRTHDKYPHTDAKRNKDD